MDQPATSRVVDSFSVITTTANPMVARVHDRMPVVLDRVDGHDVFIRHMLRPYPAESMDCYRVSKLENSAANDGPEVIEVG